VGLIGSPEGIPLKIDSSGSVRDPNASAIKFLTTSDSFPGNSGSGVYETDSYQLAGILVAGEFPDYVRKDGEGCHIYRQCPETGCLGVQVNYPWPAIQSLCQIHPEYPICGHRNEEAFFVQDSNGAQQNTRNHLVFLPPGQTIDFGTCAVPGSSGQFNTQLRLYSPTGANVATNDDGGGSCGQLSHATYTVPKLRGGLYELRAGCSGSSTCYGTTAYTTSGPTSGTLTYDAANTASATTGTRNVNISLRVGETLTVGTCGVEQAYVNGNIGSGDTFLRLFSGTTELVNNDDLNTEGCGLGSRITFRASTAGTYQLRAGCYASNTCSATISYVIEPTGWLTYSASNTNSATMNTANTSVRLEVGDRITAGTCGIPNATFTGDTYLRMYNENNLSSQVAFNDDACGGLGSQFAYTATAAGTYQIQSGCFSIANCTGTTVYKVVRKGNGTGSFTFNTSNTASATTGYKREAFILPQGANFMAGTCGVSGSSGTGDSYLRLFGPDGSEVLDNDEGGCGSGLSKMTYFIAEGGDGAYEVRAGCSGNVSCSGTVAYTE